MGRFFLRSDRPRWSVWDRLHDREAYKAHSRSEAKDMARRLNAMMTTEHDGVPEG